MGKKNLKIEGKGEYWVNIPAFVYRDDSGKQHDIFLNDAELDSKELDNQGNPKKITVKGAISIIEESKDVEKINFFKKAIEWLLEIEGQQFLFLVSKAEGGE